VSDPASLSLAGAASALARRELSPVDLVEACLARADRWEPAISSLAFRLDERALATARDAEQELVAGRCRSPLHGIPVTVKDLIDVAGVPTEAGSRVLAGNVPERGAHVSERLEAAGAIVLGKARTHEFAWGGTTPPARNPWQRDRIPGGSSGGSGAGIAAGIGYASIGSDTAGSVRSPASFNGVVGLKPTYGLVGRSGLVPLAWSLDTVGVLARAIDDVPLVLDAISGRDPRDPTSLADPPEHAGPLVSRGIDRMRVGVLEQLFAATQADVEARQRAAIALLGQAGASVAPIALEPPDVVDAALPAAFAICAAESASWHGAWLDERRELYGRDVLRYLLTGRELPAVAYLDAQRVRRRVAEALAAALRGVDLLVGPTHTHVAPRVDEETIVYDRGEPMHRDPAGIRCLVHANLAGLPAVSVPVGIARGLPVGLQVIGPPRAEALVLHAARAIEDAAGFRGLEPPAP
jgi:aspartyl-tRNA(Asn)/glutamyl-tRNA(Gln) amidotransferase subunit A